MRRVFPDLPKTAAQAIWRNTSAAERLHMHNQPGMPRQMAEEALVALRDVRLAEPAKASIWIRYPARTVSDWR